MLHPTWRDGGGCRQIGCTGDGEVQVQADHPSLLFSLVQVNTTLERHDHRDLDVKKRPYATPLVEG